MKPALVVPRSQAQSARRVLEARGLWDKTRKLQKYGNDEILIPVITMDRKLLALNLEQAESLTAVIQSDLPMSKCQQQVKPVQQLLRSVNELLGQSDISHEEKVKLLSEVPTHWEKHGDLVLLPAHAFVSQLWSLWGQELWASVAASVGASRVARQSIVKSDGFRSPQVSLLLGDNALVQHTDNAIKYEYDLTKCMFSVGNITEKMRVARFDCMGETVVDLYAGIGYFTLPYLVHAGASYVHACEWNPHAVAALARNLELNGVEDRCSIHAGDNRQLKLRGLADRVNLGLIPSSEAGWPVACQVLKAAGGMMHIHGNINCLTGLREQHPFISEDGPSVEETPVCHQQISALPDNTLADRASAQDNLCDNFEETELNLSCTDIVHIRQDCNLARQVAHDEKNEEGSNLGAGTPYQKSEGLSCQSCHHAPLLGERSPSGLVSEDCHQSQHPCTDQFVFNIKDNLPTSNCCISSHKYEQCHKWGLSVCGSLKMLLEKQHGGSWLTALTHIELVKSYAPHVYHVVLDICCSPVSL